MKLCIDPMLDITYLHINNLSKKYFLQFACLWILLVPSILGEKSDFLVSEEPKLGTEEAARSPEGSQHHQRHAMDTIMEEAERSQESKEERARQSRQSFSFTSFGPFSGDTCCLYLRHASDG